MAGKILRHPKAMIGLALIVVVTLSGLWAGLVVPHDPLKQSLASRLSPPMSAHARGTHLLGTDHLGRDVLSRIVYGSRVSLLISVLAVLLAGLAGTAVGLIAGYRGGRVDAVLMRIAEIQLACPTILLALAIAAVLRPNLRSTVLVIAVTSWVVYARVVRSRTLYLRGTDFVGAARALGAGELRLIFRHILPNMVSTCIVLGTLQGGRAIVLESSLTFLGLGVQPPTPSWGGMLTEGRAYMASAWWITSFAGSAIMLTVLGMNLLGDALRDILDPKLKA